MQLGNSGEDFLKDDVCVADCGEVFVYDNAVTVDVFEFFLMVVVVVSELDDCVLEFVVFVYEEPCFVTEYRVCFDCVPVVADEVVGVFEAEGGFGVKVFYSCDFKAFYTYIIYRGRF